MKKLVVLSLLLFYMTSLIKPCAPAIIAFVAKKVWEHSHSNRVDKMKGRVNFLLVLTDMSKHNTPKQDATPQPDATKSGSSLFAYIFPKLNCSFYSNEVFEKYFPHYIFKNQIVFQQITTPPPKSV